jgi:beta-lactam-binding protein with PASTA domain
VKFFRALTKWQFWASIVLMALAIYGLYHFTFRVFLDTYTNHNEEIEIPDLSKMTIQDAMKTLEDLNLTYEIDSVKFDSTKAPYAILDYYPQKGFKVKEGRRIFIKSNPRTWLPVELPDIMGKSKRLAFTQLKLAGLEVGDTIYEPDIAKDAVLRVMFQGKQISNKTVLPRFSKVDIVLGKGLEYGVKMQSLVGMGLDQARSTIVANQFEIGRLTVEGSVSDSSLLRVFYQYPIAGDNYDQGLPVDLWLSEKQPSELGARVKDLDRQYRNDLKDSAAIAEYERELNMKDRKELSTEQSPSSPQSQLPPKNVPQNQPEGVQID